MPTPLARPALVAFLGMFCSLACAPKQSADQANVTPTDFTPRAAQGVLAEGRVERLDPSLDVLIPRDAQVEKLVDGLDWCEGPVWVRAGQLGLSSPALLFSDVPQNTVYKLDPNTRAVEIFLKPSGYTSLAKRGGETGSNGLTIDAQGNLVLCQHGDRRVARLAGAEAKTFISVAESYEGKRFNSPNDLVFDRNGNLFFTDPPYGLEKNMADPLKELPFQGVYRVSSDGKLTLLTKDLTRPNGIALSPDEKTLYVAVSDPDAPKVWAFDLREDGTIANQRVFFDASKLAGDKSRKGLPDGMKVDARGNVFCTGPGGVMVLSPEGKHLGTILTGQATSNCAWGDDGQTLYITADMYVLRVRTATRGKGW